MLVVYLKSTKIKIIHLDGIDLSDFLCNSHEDKILTNDVIKNTRFGS